MGTVVKEETRKSDGETVQLERDGGGGRLKRGGRGGIRSRLYILIWRRQYIFKLEFIRCQRQRARSSE